MNYYIQGNAAKAEQIKAAFEKLGYDISWPGGFASPDVINIGVKRNGAKYVVAETSEYIKDIIKTHPDYKELELPVEPKFKIGDWIARDYDGFTMSIESLKDGSYYFNQGGSISIKAIDEYYHLWTIADAKDGDVLETEDYIFIFKYILHSGVHLYCHYNIDDEEFDSDIPDAIIGNIHDKGAHFQPATKEQRDLLFAKIKESGHQWDADKKELRKIIEPNFKVGDWVVTDYGKVSQVVSVDKDGDGYTLDDGVYFSGSWCDMYHHWTIQDAKDGDVLTNGKLIIIFNKLEEPAYKQHIIAYVGLDLCVRLQITEDTWQLGVDKAMPATKEQRDLLFKKMKEAGYEWDADKKELRKIQPHYDIKNFKPKQWVLVRDDDEWEWALTRFSYLSNGSASLFVCINGASFQQCIPFEDNEKLLGTTDMCDEQYINW